MNTCLYMYLEKKMDYEFLLYTGEIRGSKCSVRESVEQNVSIFQYAAKVKKNQLVMQAHRCYMLSRINKITHRKHLYRVPKGEFSLAMPFLRRQR